MKGFKLVFTNCSGRMTSFNCPKDSRVEYSTTKWTRPRKGCGPLFVYKRLGLAKAELGFGGEVWKCEYVPFKGKLHQTPYGPLAGWAGEKHGVPLAYLPKFVGLASRVKLIKRVAS